MMRVLLLTAVLCGVVMWAAAVSPIYKPPPLPFCPPEDKRWGFLCHIDCETDADCGIYERCCPLNCGKRCLEKYQATTSPNCPNEVDDRRCIVYNHQCSNDEECSRNSPSRRYCCPSNCGNECREGGNTKYG